MTYANPHFLVETDWLEAHLGDAGLRVIDCRIDMLPAEGGGLRFVPATNAWKEEHIPGATFVDFHEDLSDREHKLLFMLPSAQQFAAVMSRHGVGDGTRVVLYDGFMNALSKRSSR
jgi:thiosulfate/3-mercaptopyruvate sulfurtransferase